MAIAGKAPPTRAAKGPRSLNSALHRSPLRARFAANMKTFSWRANNVRREI
jgi:hypothetical protein